MPDSQMCFEIMFTLERIINEFDSAGNNVHREIFKVAKTHLYDRAMHVRSAAAMCLIALINQNNFMYTSELEENVTLNFCALDGSNYEVRYSIKKYLAALLAATQETISNPNQSDDGGGAGETLGRLTRVVGDGHFVVDIAQICFDRLKEFRDVSSRTGYSLALGCLHRYIGRMGIGQYLNLSLSILRVLKLLSRITERK